MMISNDFSKLWLFKSLALTIYLTSFGTLLNPILKVCVVNCLYFRNKMEFEFGKVFQYSERRTSLYQTTTTMVGREV